jgi:spore coat polysaccharide biosynthesis predicted glycosyltransferase SpsG
MVFIRTDDFPGPERGRIHRTFYLALLLRKQVPISFILDKKNRLPREFRKKNISALYPEPMDKEGISGKGCVLFELRAVSQADQRVMDWAKETGLMTVQFADFGENPLPVDAVVDPAPERQTDYPKDRKALLGPEYALLHTKFRHFNRARRVWRKRLKNLLLIQDRGMPYRRLRDLLDSLIRHHFQVKLSPSPELRKSQRKILRRVYPQLRFVGEVESLARPFFEADLALVPAGSAAYEAAACGTPALYLCSSARDDTAAQAFEKSGLGFKADFSHDGSGSRIIEQIGTLDPEQRRAMGERARETVDGLGVYRIIDFLEKNHMI